MQNTLKKLGIAITRPEKQASALAKNILKVGGCPLVFPLIEITPLNDRATIEQLESLSFYDVIIFISINAVEQCIKLVGIGVLKSKVLVTTGKKTAEALELHGLKVDFCPEKFFNSEALLSIKEFKKQSINKNITIIRGSSGRDYLKNNLIDLGARVDYIGVYKRHCPQTNLDKLKTHWQQNNLDVVLLTSASSTACFFELAKNEDWINDLTILIGSSRMQHEIPEQFKGKIVIADDPSDETLLKKLTLEF